LLKEGVVYLTGCFSLLKKPFNKIVPFWQNNYKTTNVCSKVILTNWIETDLFVSGVISVQELWAISAP
jgi:hypothetical protein